MKPTQRNHAGRTVRAAAATGGGVCAGVMLPLLVLLVLLMPGTAGAQQERKEGSAKPAQPVKAGSGVFATICAACHGDKGQGKVELKTPSIAGLPDWYVLAQLTKFRSKLRGGHEKDVTGAQMHAIAITLDGAKMKEAAGVISRMKLHATKQTLKGDADKGMYVYMDNCMECHRYNGAGEIAFRSGQLVGLQDWYMAAQLKKFREGVRGGDRKDVDGTRMHEVAGGLSDKDIDNILAYVARLAERYVGELNAEIEKRR